MAIKRNITYSYLALLLIASGSQFGQSGKYTFLPASPISQKHSSFVKSGDVFGTRVFVENKGQFDSKSPNNEKIQFAFDDGVEKIYFTSRGLIYEKTKTFPLSEREREAQEEGKNVKEKDPEIHYTFMNWVGTSGAELSIEAAEKQHHYITYGSAEYNSCTFKKITYKNVYKSIDIEYTIPADKEYGIKYSVVLHPGADPNNIRILYSGAVNKTKLNNKGEIIIKTPLDDITEHLPMSYYENRENISSRFTLHHDTIGFEFPEGFQKSRSVIIDPWVTSVTTLTLNNLCFDVDYDLGGNAFVFGSFGYTKLAMYNLAGVLQWTFSGLLVSPSWSSQAGLSGSVGNFVVDKFTSKSYIGPGQGNPRIIRLTANGVYDNFITPTTQLYQELWEMGFHCTSGEIYVLGGGHTSNLSAATINTVSATLNLSTFQPLNTAFVHDISAQCLDDAGNIFVYYACSNTPLNHKICRVNSTFNGNVWTQPSTFTNFQEINNKNVYASVYGGSINSAGYNGLSANANFLYYYDGANLAAYDKTTGTLVATTSTGLVAKRTGGIAVDDCNRIYLGGNGAILTYSFNGTIFSTLTPISLSLTITNQVVFDVKLNRNTQTLFVCGSGFVGTYPALGGISCPAPLSLCIFSQAGLAASTSSITCATLGSATVTPSGGMGPFTYTWLPSNQNGNVGTGLSPGTYTVMVYDVGYNATYVTTTTFLSAIPLTGSLSATSMLNCASVNNGTAAILNLSGGSGNQNYLWTNGINTYTTSLVSGLSAGNYTVTVTDALTGCVFSPTFTILQPFILSSFIIASTPTACIGSSITLTGITSGGIPSYTYSWSPGINVGPGTNTMMVSQNTAGSYTYNLLNRDVNNCTVTAAAVVNFIPDPPITISNTSLCPLANGTLAALGASSYTWENGSTGNSFTASPLANTSYSLVGSALGCTASASAFMILHPVPVPILSSNSPVCNGQVLQMAGMGGSTYKWNGPLAFTSFVQSPLITPSNPNHSGVYNLTVTSANGCTAATSASLTVNPTPTLTAAGSTVCVTGIMILNSSSIPGATYSWQGPLGYASSLANSSISYPGVNRSGFYTVTATSAVGCTNSAVAHVTVTALPIPFAGSDGPKCAGSSINFFGTGATNYAWSGPGGFLSNQQNPQIGAVSMAAMGTYTLNVTTGPCLNSTTYSLVVYPLPTPTASNSGPACETKTLQLFAGTGNTVTNYYWQGPSFSNFTKNPVRDSTKLNYSGIYTLTVLDLHMCLASAQTTVTILPNPLVTASGATVCLYEPAILIGNGASSYFWTGPMFFQSNKPNALIPSVTLERNGTYTVVGTAANSCTGTTTVKVLTRSLPQPSLTLLPKSEICLNEVLTLNGMGGQKYQWYGPNEVYYEGQLVNFTATNLSAAGTYTLKVTDGKGCSASISTLITVFDLPNGSLIGSKMQGCVPLCADFVFEPSTTKPSKFLSTWKINGANLVGQKFSHCFMVVGDNLISGHFYDSSTTCLNNVDFHVTAFPKPEADFEFAPTKPIENTDEVIFTNTSKGEQQFWWNWYISDSRSFRSSSQNTSYLFSEQGRYPVVLIVRNTWGCSDSIIKTVIVEEDFHVYVPNVFTPNEDNRNELFLPIGRGVKSFHISIYDRWGAKIFESKDLASGWDGTYKGEPCKSDIYTWKIEVSSIHGENKVLTGHVTLYR